ncbi:MAG TPA: hypothetical protein DCS82_06290 [Rhodospirillaceae bacterium]|nr:hypothetical protein [Rhodospirillaceae bacterium]HAA92580.1 hypothetical protein [Rhodospirillaceae bacterium]HAT35306.1 hypothetical protein [Rhodospirillaceae bacterium]|tara:strand:+ start:35 stop:694 length:660 start_codon:yes stop_codon:yes gene_type:complete
MSDELQNLTYAPEIFQVENLEEAKSIILTPEGESSTEERWEKETPYLRDEILKFLEPAKDTLLLDFGCGVGRMAKALIEISGCRVIGVDISQPMRQFAPGYVNSPHFSICSPEVVRALIDNGLQVDCAIAIWILQHCPNVEDEIAMLKSLLKPGGRLFVCNSLQAAVPTDVGWVDTGFDVKSLLAENLEEISRERLSPDHVVPLLSATGFMGKYQKKED